MGFRCATINIEKLADQINMDVEELKTAARNARVGGFARLWSFEDKGNFGLGNISVSQRNQQSNEYETQFKDGFVCFSGGAYQKVKDIDIPENGVSIIILNCDVRNKYDKEKKQMYTNFYVYDIELSNNSNGNTNGNRTQRNNKASSNKKPAPHIENTAPVDNNFTEVEDEELPF